MWMTSLANGGDFFLKNLVFVPGLPLCRTRTIWCDDYLQINMNQTRTRIDTMQWDAIRWNTMATRCNTKQYGGDGESIRLRYDVMRTWQELIGTYTNQCENVRSNTIMRSLRIVLQHTESQQTGSEPQCECQWIDTNVQRWDTNQWELKGIDTTFGDPMRTFQNIRIGLRINAKVVVN